MANLTVQGPYDPNRPDDPRDPTGIAHAESAAAADTKADRAAAKLAWAQFVDDWKAAKKAGTTLPDFTSNTIAYPDD